ncbi:MAG TPA: Uma2 family endonuclease [Caulobacteraceae bacterium]|nr:Uma2 family endonuclease [Caulobacteraceae bacterium]
MNAPLTTRAAEGYDRRAFTVEEIWAMQRAGLLDEESPFELWEGELVVMSPKQNRHEIWKRRLDRILQRGLPDELDVAVEPSLYLSDMTFLEPDLLVHPGAILPVDVRGPDVLLVIEVADSSIRKDLNPKARLYAKYGVRHYWVFDAENRRAHLLSEPAEGGYQSAQIVEADGEVTLPFEPALTIRLADLG